MDRSDPAYRGQADYSPLLLSAYDRLVLGPIARLVWRCPTQRLLERYRQHIRAPHLDVGPGTGYFIARSTLSAGSAVTIVDPNPNVLAHTSERLRKFHVTVVQADVLKPLPVEGPYESSALHLVLHCLPGPLSRKGLAVANIARVMSPTGVFFGASVLGRSGSHTWLARRVLTAFNWRGAFDNLDDSIEGLHSILEQSFERVEIIVVGSMALFTAMRPRDASRRPEVWRRAHVRRSTIEQEALMSGNVSMPSRCLPLAMIGVLIATAVPIVLGGVAFLWSRGVINPEPNGVLIESLQALAPIEIATGTIGLILFGRFAGVRGIIPWAVLFIVAAPLLLVASFVAIASLGGLAGEPF